LQAGTNRREKNSCEKYRRVTFGDKGNRAGDGGAKRTFSLRKRGEWVILKGGLEGSMADKDQLQESDFLREKIKERPLNKKKLLKQTLLTALSGLMFALIASVTFIILEPVISKTISPEETPVVVEFPDEVDISDEIAPEDMLVVEKPEEIEVNPAEADEHIEEVVAGIQWGIDDYRKLSDSVVNFVYEKQKSLVTVTGAVSNTDWFNETYESEKATSGVIFFDNEVDLLILVDRSNIAKAETITVTFSEGTTVDGHEKAYDPETGLAVIGVSKGSISNSLKDKIEVASLGSSNSVKGLEGSSVIALGSPAGFDRSVCMGRITSDNGVISKADANYRLLTTDIYGSTNASGVLINLSGDVIGFISMKEGSSDMPNSITAYGITELKKIMTKMGNGMEMPYLGIVGTDVTEEVHKEQGLPYGAFIKEIYLNSPAMLAGIQRGDVIIRVNDKPVDHMATYTAQLMAAEIGDTIEITVVRQSQEELKEMTFEVEVTANK